jgi:putative membrane protein
MNSCGTAAPGCAGFAAAGDIARITEISENCAAKRGVLLGGKNQMIKLLIHWVLSALCLLLVAHFVPGFYLTGFGSALIAAVVIGLVNSTLGILLKILTFPLTILTLGIFWLVINALMLKFASIFVPGFVVRGLWPAFWGGIILSLLNMIVRQLLKDRSE